MFSDKLPCLFDLFYQVTKLDRCDYVALAETLCMDWPMAGIKFTEGSVSTEGYQYLGATAIKKIVTYLGGHH